MDIRQFRYQGDDNLGYLLFANGEAMAVDGGAAADMIAFLDKQGLILTYVTNTHSHPDHTPGNPMLLRRTGAQWLDVGQAAKTGAIKLGGVDIRVIPTPGHTHDSVCFYTPPFLVSGDTLFNGKVGRCFTGDLKSFYDAIQVLLKLPAGTLVYAGHDYVEEYMEFARRVEPDNPHIDEYLKNYDPTHVRAALEEEMKVNPFLRLDSPEVISFLKERRLPAGTEFERFTSLISQM